MHCCQRKCICGSLNACSDQVFATLSMLYLQIGTVHNCTNHCTLHCVQIAEHVGYVVFAVAHCTNAPMHLGTSCQDCWTVFFCHLLWTLVNDVTVPRFELDNVCTMMVHSKLKIIDIWDYLVIQVSRADRAKTRGFELSNRPFWTLTRGCWKILDLRTVTSVPVQNCLCTVC